MNRIAQLMPDSELLESAKYAYGIAPTSCSGHADHTPCDWYHGSWQFFRVLDLVSTPTKHIEHFSSEVKNMRDDGHFQRLLVSGTADYGMLQLLHKQLDGITTNIEMTVVDRCATPLKICQWYAERHGFHIDTIHQDVLGGVPPSAFDAIFTHSFLGYFSDEDRRSLLMRLRDGLRPGGRLVTVQRIREDYPYERLSFTSNEIEAFVTKVAQLGADYADEIGPIDLASLAREYARNMGNWPLKSAASLRGMFEACGFKLRRFECLSVGQPGDITGPSVPNSTGYYMITAERV